MNLFSGLEKFGFSGGEDVNILDDGKKKKEKAAEKQKEAPKPLEEKDYLLRKTVKCPVCDNQFSSLVVRSGKLRRQGADPDLRPIFEGIDTIKYDVYSCPHCGYSAMTNYFEGLSSTQIKLIKAEISSKFRPVRSDMYETYTYEQAVERFKLSLISTMTKRAKLSEKSYTCLKIAWLLREQIKTLPEGTDAEKEVKAEKQAEYDEFYRQAYEGFLKVSSSEMPPFCGMDSNTLDYLLANMAAYHKQYDVAMKLIARLLGNKAVSNRIKERCRDLKEQIQEEVKAQG